MMKKTPLHSTHVSLGARMIEFAGWEMPVQYTSITEEHMAVRTAAGMFDVSHMGDLIIRGEGARELLQRLLTNDITGAGVGQAVYAHIPDDRGRILDDTIVTQIRRGEYLLVPNAGTTPKILAWVREHATKEEVVDASDRLACIALQGPRSERILQTLTPYDLSTMRRFTGDFVDLHFTGNPLPPTLHDFRPTGFLTDLFSFEVSQRPRGVPKAGGGFAEQCYVSRTGYTGEDGFEILMENSSAASLWGLLMHVGKGYGLIPAGLGARDTLRLEMGYLLSGTDFDGTQTSLQTGPSWVVTWDHEFIGRDALLEQKRLGNYRRLVGFEMVGRGIPRHGYPIMAGGAEIGKVTSGTMSPMLSKGIGLGYVDAGFHKEGTDIGVGIRDATVPATVARPPFIRR